MCTRCEWQAEAERAEEIAEQLPAWMTRRVDLASGIANTIREIQHATEKQTETLDELESHVDD